MNSYCMQHIMQFLFPSPDRHVCAQKSTHGVHAADMFGYKDMPVLAVGCGVHFKYIPHSVGWVWGQHAAWS